MIINKKYILPVLIFFAGLIILVVSSYTRTFSSETIQLITLLLLFLLCGFVLRRFFSKVWAYPIIFIAPSLIVITYALLTNHLGFYHYLSELIIILLSFFFGFFFYSYKKRVKLILSIFFIIFNFLYIIKINPELDFYNNTVRRKELIKDIGNPISDYSFLNPTGKEVKLASYKGKVVLIDFYFNNCYQCRLKLPSLLKVIERYKENKDFDYLLIHRGGNESFDNFLEGLKKFPIGLNYVYDSASFGTQKLGITGYPHEIIIDKNGYIKEQLVGFNETTSLVYEKKTSDKIEKLLNEKN